MKALYFTDDLYNEERIREEMHNIDLRLHLYLKEAEFTIDPPFVNEYTIDPPFMGFGNEKYYDILFFDWGGVLDSRFSTVCNFIECIIEEAKECPSRFYVVTSQFSGLLYEFRQIVEKEFNGDKPFNVFLSLDDFIEYYKKYNQ
jgi:hypothetical protein